MPGFRQKGFPRNGVKADEEEFWASQFSFFKTEKSLVFPGGGLEEISPRQRFFLARGLAFDVLVCLIPALFLLFVLFGFLFDSSRETIQYMSSYLKSMIPFSQQQVLRNLFALVLWVYYSCLVFILGAEMGWLWSRKKKTAE